MNETESGKLTREIEGINSWIGHINGRLSSIESIINEEETKQMIAEVSAVTRVINGDSTLNVPPLYQTITELHETVLKMQAYQEEDIKHRDDMKIIIGGLIFTSAITLVLSVIGVLT